MMLALSALLSSLLSPFAYLITGSAAGLVTLRKGSVYGLKILIAGSATLIGFALIAGLSWKIALIFFVGVWLPVWCVASILRITESQGLAVFCAALLAMLVISGFYVALDDVGVWWLAWSVQILERADLPAEQFAAIRNGLTTMAGLINAIMIVCFMMNVISGVLVSRWWQAALFNEGAFRKEFHALSLPVAILPVSMLLLLLVIITDAALEIALRDMLIVLVFMFLIQGIAAVHRNVAGYALSGVWLIVMYLFLLLLPQSGILIACLGLTDVYLHWRKKTVQKTVN